MAVRASRITVTDTATPLLVGDPTDTFPGQSLAIVVISGSIDIGGADVTTGGGWPLAAGVPTAVDLQPGEAIYGIAAASATAPVAVLRTGV